MVTFPSKENVAGVVFSRVTEVVLPIPPSFSNGISGVFFHQGTFFVEMPDFVAAAASEWHTLVI